jgi:hypothetical protein
MGLLYGTSIAWGVGVGIWIDSEIWHDEDVDPGLAVIAPALFGIAAPATVFLVDRFAFRRGMPEGLPSAISAGLLVGAGEGLGIAGTQWVVADEENEWGFRGLARAEVISSTIGAIAGAGLYYGLKPVPETNVLIASSTFWGASIGSMLAGGATTAFDEWGATNDWVAIGGLVGFNVAVLGAVGASIAWTPSWEQIGWGWGGFAIGGVASLPIYAFYAGSDHDPRRGLIFTSIATTVGLGLGLALAPPRRAQRRNPLAEHEVNEDPIQLHGVGLMPVGEEGMGIGIQALGALY